ncbi:MAG: hypothetical protein U1E02_25840, partial [Hydrogenophaga sp.]|nr:hypothetical protein [Hydrogenophaga sp.]
ADGNSNPIYITSSTGTGIVMDNPLKLYANGVGGEIYFGTDLSAQSLVLFGSGNTTTYTGTYNYANGQVLNDSLRIEGNVSVTTGSGNMSFGQAGFPYYIVGGVTSPNVNDTLTLTANGGGNINFISRIGGAETGAPNSELLKGLTITAANNVTFQEEVIINGNLIINATGTVSFAKGVTLTDGGSLTITSANLVTFGANSPITLTGGGNLLLEANEIELAQASGQIQGTGSVTLRPTDKTMAIAVGSPQGVGTQNVLNLDTSEIRTLADGFSKIVIGWESGGNALAGSSNVVTVGANNFSTTDPLFLDDVAIYGGSINVADFSSSAFTLSVQAGESLTLNAVNNIEIANAIEADSITLISALGSVSQADSAGDGQLDEAIRSLELVVSAKTGINLDAIETSWIDAQNTGTGNVSLVVNGVRAAPGRLATVNGDVNVVRLAQTDASGGSIALSTLGGTVTVQSGVVSNTSLLSLNGKTAAGVTNAGTGAVSLTAQGTGKDMVVNQAITSRGALSLVAANSITTGAGVALSATTDGSDISLTATAGNLLLQGNVSSGITTGGLVTLLAGGSLTMASGTAVSSLGASGRASLQAGGNVNLSRLLVGAGASVTSISGAIVDALVGDGLNIDGDSASLTLIAATGIGATGAALQTRVATLEANNSVSGGLFIVEATGLEIRDNPTLATPPVGIFMSGVTNAAGLVSVVLTTGNLVVTDTVNSAATGTGSGNILLQTLAGDIAVNTTVSSSAGNISLLASGILNLGNLNG